MVGELGQLPGLVACKMKKNIFITIGIILIILLIGDIIRRVNNNSSTDNTEPPAEIQFVDSFTGDTPVQPNNSQSHVTVKNKNNEDVKVLDFRLLEESTVVGESFYHIDGGSNDISLPYSILYNDVDYSYTISLEAKPLSTVRERASADFLKMLDISAEEACTLNVYVGVTYSIDPALSGGNLGLSYCKDSVSL